jgi:hypothetical protein
LSAANALPKNPASVIAICIIDKNLEGFEVSLLNVLALLSPSDINLFSFASFVDKTAISAQAKNALSKISTTCNNRGIATSIKK